MNREHVTNLIDHLKTIPSTSFNMSTWLAVSETVDGNSHTFSHYEVAVEPERFLPKFQEVNLCGTVGCIAGHAVVVAVKHGKRVPYKSARDIASDYLDLTYDEGTDLFTPGGVTVGYQIDYAKVEPHHAILVLENMLATDTIDWRIAGPEIKMDDEPLIAEDCGE